MLSATEVAVAVWCVRIFGVCALIAVTALAVASCVNYVAQVGQNVKLVMEFLAWRRDKREKK